MGKSSDPPQGVDYNTLVPLQGAENRRTYDYGLQQSRTNTVTPGGTSTWSRTPQYDSIAYYQALNNWERQNGQEPSQWSPNGAPNPNMPWVSPPLPGNATASPPPPPVGQAQPTPQGLPDGQMRRLSAGDVGASVGGPGDNGGIGGNVGNSPGVGSDGPNGADPGAGSPGAGGGPSDVPGNVPGAGGAASPDPFARPSVRPVMTDFINYNWTNTQQLSPEQQRLYDQNQTNQIAGSQQIGSAQERIAQALSKPFNPQLSQGGSAVDAGQQGGVYTPQQMGSYAGGTPGAGATQAELARLSGRIEGMDSAGFAGDAADALYRQGTRYLDPQVQSQQSALEARLAEQGFVPGTPGYTKAMDDFRASNERTYADARDRALTLGTSVGSNQFRDNLSGIQAQIAAAMQGGNFGLDTAGSARADDAQGFSQRVQNQSMQRQGVMDANEVASRLFDRQVTASGQNTQTRQAQLAEALAMRTQPLNELASLRSGNPYQMPNLAPGQSGGGGGPNPADIMGAANNQYGQQVNAYNAQVGQDNSNNQAMASIATALAMYFSDRRLKTNIELVGSTKSGTPVYEWTYITGGPRVRGVMADEAGDAATLLPGGFAAVDYSKVR